MELARRDTIYSHPRDDGKYGVVLAEKRRWGQDKLLRETEVSPTRVPTVCVFTTQGTGDKEGQRGLEGKEMGLGRNRRAR